MLGHPFDLTLHTNAGPFFDHNQILLWLAKLTAFVASLSGNHWGPPEKGWAPKCEIGHPLLLLPPAWPPTIGITLINGIMFRPT